MESLPLHRSPYPDPSHPDKGDGVISEAFNIHFRHPGYEDTGNIFLILPALDPGGGILLDFALESCGLFVNNNWSGFFTEDRDGKEKVHIRSGGILRRENYYFRVTDNPTGKYPMLMRFKDWAFPHNNLPPSWVSCRPPIAPPDRRLPRQGSLTEAVLARDVTCRVTNHVEGTEHAHLLPRAQDNWLQRNAMFRYNNLSRIDVDGIEDPRNAILLRSDTHGIFDQKRFVIVPKTASTTSKNLTFVIHVLAPGISSELTKCYHNVVLQQITGVALEFLFARFAWTMFSFASVFLQPGVNRILYVCENGQIVAREFSGQDCKLILSGSRSRSASPKKRKPEALEESTQDCADDEEARGRKRRRFSDTSSPLRWATDSSTLSPDTQTLVQDRVFEIKETPLQLQEDGDVKGWIDKLI